MRTSAKKCFTIGSAALVVAVSWYLLAPDLHYPEWVPKSARWVRSSEWGQWLSYDAQVRFEAPLVDCLEAAEAVIAAHKKEMPELSGFDYTQKTIDAEHGLASPRAGFDDENKWWFKPESIKRGVYFGQASSHNPQIWIDADRSIFYYKRTD